MLKRSFIIYHFLLKSNHTFAKHHFLPQYQLYHHQQYQSSKILTYKINDIIRLMSIINHRKGEIVFQCFQSSIFGFHVNFRGVYPWPISKFSNHFIFNWWLASAFVFDIRKQMRKMKRGSQAMRAGGLRHCGARLFFCRYEDYTTQTYRVFNMPI